MATIDTYMGQYNGKVIAIENDRLVLEERYVHKEGERILRALTIPLQRKAKKEG